MGSLIPGPCLFPSSHSLSLTCCFLLGPHCHRPALCSSPPPPPRSSTATASPPRSSTTAASPPHSSTAPLLRREPRAAALPRSLSLPWVCVLQRRRHQPPPPPLR